MRPSETMNEQMEDKYTIYDLMDSRVTECDEECQKKGKRNLVLLGLAFIMFFVAGYFINPSILRNVWLIASGTLAVITGLLLFLIQVGIISLKC